MKIVHVADYLMPPMAYQEFLLPKWNARRGHDVDIVTSDRFTPVESYEETWGDLLGPRICGTGVEEIGELKVHRLPCRWEWKSRRRPWIDGLERAIGKLSPDVVFCHGTASFTSLRLARFCGQARIPVLMDNHMTFSSQNRSISGRLSYSLLRFAVQRFHGSVYRFLGVAEECCDFLKDAQNVPAEKIECLPLGVDTDLFSLDDRARDRVRQEYGVPADAKVLMQTGKMTRGKGAHWLAEAAVKCMKERRDVWLLFVGSGPHDYLERVRSLIDGEGMGDRLRIVPFVPASKLTEVFSAADICVYPGESSMSCLEAAACERVVIITDEPAGKWREKMGVGFCYRQGDASDLAAKIMEFLREPEKLRPRGERARRAVLEHFSYDRIAQRAEDLMNEAIADFTSRNNSKAATLG